MTKRTLCRSVAILAACGAVAVFCQVSAQEPLPPAPPPIMVNPPTTPPPPPIEPAAVSLPADPPPPAPAAAGAAPGPTVDSLIERLEQLRAQRIEIERQEKEVAATLRQLFKQQQDRLKRLGIAETAEPPAVGPKGTSF